MIGFVPTASSKNAPAVIIKQGCYGEGRGGTRKGAVEVESTMESDSCQGEGSLTALLSASPLYPSGAGPPRKGPGIVKPFRGDFHHPTHSPAPRSPLKAYSNV